MFYRLDEIWDEATGAWKDVNDGNLSDAGKKLLSLTGNSAIEIFRVLDLVMIGGGVKSLVSSGTVLVKREVADFVGRLLRSADPSDATRLTSLFKNSLFKAEWRKEVDNIQDVRRAVGKYIDYDEVKSLKFTRDAVEVNKTYPASYNPLPHKPGASVTEYVRSGADIGTDGLVRIHGDLGASGTWLIRKSDFEALKVEAQNLNRNLAEFLQERLALPTKPTSVSDFVPPVDKTFAVRESTVNPVSPELPNQTQFEVLKEDEDLLEEWFKNRRSL